MSNPYIMTYRDIYDALLDYVGRSTGSASQRDIVRAIQNAYQEFVGAHAWDYYTVQGRIITNAHQTSSTITYDHTGGTYEREMTIAAGTWPSWIEFGRIRVGVVIYHVEERKSDTVITLDPVLNPGADIAAGTSYTAFRSVYPLPADCVDVGEPLSEDNWWYGRYVQPQDFLALERHGFEAGTMYAYTIMGDPNLYGQLAFHFYPYQSSAVSLDYVYKRRPRQMKLTGHKTAHSVGTVSVTADTATLNGTSTTFDSTMVGAIVRFASDSTTTPTGLDGLDPAAEERSIITFTNATTAVLDANSTSGHSGVSYVISDPVDIEQALIPMFMRCCEKHISILRRMEDLDTSIALYDMALRKAKSASSRVKQRRYAGDGRPWRFRRLAHYPLGDDQA